MDSKKRAVEEAEALALAREVDEIYAAKGKRLVHLDLRREKPDAATLRNLLIGPSGKLRAPTLRAGRRLLVGFNEEAYRKVLGR